MKAFLFPGQGSQEIGMAEELFQGDAAFCRLVQRASECAGADLRKLCLRGPERELVKTEFLQPLLVAVSLGYYRRLLGRDLEPDIVLGHSLGEITALAAAGVLTDDEAVQVAARRGQLMGAAAARSPGGMLAVLSPQRTQVLARLSGLLQAGQVSLANDNAPGQMVFSGASAGLAAAAETLRQAKLGPYKRLPVSGPWHSPLMAPASEQFALWLAGLAFKKPRIPVLMNTSATAEVEPETIRRLVVRNLTEPVQWRACMERLKELRIQELFEIGPGRVLSGLARANGLGDPIRVFNISNQRGLELATHHRPPSVRFS
jgi:[acyl-carrier-protein] S-malonyltransferase